MLFYLLCFLIVRINFCLTTTFITDRVNNFLFAVFIDDSLEIEDDAKSHNHAVSPEAVTAQTQKTHQKYTALIR